MEFKEFEGNGETEMNAEVQADVDGGAIYDSDGATRVEAGVDAEVKAIEKAERIAKATSTASTKTKTKTTTRGKLVLAVIIAIILLVSYRCIKSITSGSNKTIHNAMVIGDVIGISPRATGEVMRIDVQTGQQVKKGDVLYLLDDKEPSNELKHAEAMLEIAKTELDKAVGGALIQEIVAAQTLVLQANADYDSKTASRDSIKNSMNTLDRTYNMLLKQMISYINPKNGSYDSDYAMKLLNNRYSKKLINDTQFTIQAQIIREQFQFKAQLEAQLVDLKGQVRSSNSSIEASKAAIQNSESRLKLISDGVSNKDMAILVSKVKAAKIAYDQAKAAVEHTKVRAPQDGTVVQIIAHKGEMAVPGKSVLYIADMEKLYISALVDANEIEQVKLGQSVEVKLEAWLNADRSNSNNGNSNSNSNINNLSASNKNRAMATATGVAADVAETTAKTTTAETFHGTITEIGVSTMAFLETDSQDNKKANRSKHAVPVKITFDNKDKRLIIGMDAEIDME